MSSRFPRPEEGRPGGADPAGWRWAADRAAQGHPREAAGGAAERAGLGHQGSEDSGPLGPQVGAAQSSLMVFVSSLVLCLCTQRLSHSYSFFFSSKGSSKGMIIEVLPARLSKCLLIENVLTEGVRDHQRELGFSSGINRGHANGLGHAQGMSHSQIPFVPHVHGAETSPTLRGPWINTSLIAQLVNHLPAMQETRARFLGREDPLEKEMAIHSSTLAWKVPWTEEPDRLQS